MLSIIYVNIAIYYKIFVTFATFLIVNRLTIRAIIGL